MSFIACAVVVVIGSSCFLALWDLKFLELWDLFCGTLPVVLTTDVSFSQHYIRLMDGIWSSKFLGAKKRVP
jgi:hypothetical protein